MEAPILENAKFEFSQEGNCNSTPGFVEVLTIECDSSLGIDRDEGCYYVLKSETGWSIDGVEDLQKLFDRIEKIIKK